MRWPGTVARNTVIKRWPEEMFRPDDNKTGLPLPGGGAKKVDRLSNNIN